ncbi:unnamed protein product [Ilex paraguariensis]|uniref:Uncharacterized protein n=1 Tax=Ilex paraguariensis TaxID=185542 RepID=A0ABC8TR38_9AQUA
MVLGMGEEKVEQIPVETGKEDGSGEQEKQDAAAEEKKYEVEGEIVAALPFRLNSSLTPPVIALILSVLLRKMEGETIESSQPSYSTF